MNCGRARPFARSGHASREIRGRASPSYTKPERGPRKATKTALTLSPFAPRKCACPSHFCGAKGDKVCGANGVILKRIEINLCLVSTHLRSQAPCQGCIHFLLPVEWCLASEVVCHPHREQTNADILLSLDRLKETLRLAVSECRSPSSEDNFGPLTTEQVRTFLKRSQVAPTT